LQPKKRSRLKGYWLSVENKKNFILKFAEERSFDPYDPHNWETITNADIHANKVTLASHLFV